MKVSVIIPVYNVEDYIEECIHSLLQQTLNDIELIIVNDGTKDSSIEKIQYLINRHKHIKLINQNNLGLSAARNTGLEYASGDYVAFIDSDDYIEPTFLEELYNQAIKDDLDIVMGGYKIFKDNQYEIKERNPKLYDRIRTGEDFLKEELEYKDYRMEVWDDLYRLDFLKENNLCFEKGLLHEDELFTPLAMLSAKRVKLIQSNKYVYRQREGSIMSNKPNINHINSWYFIINKFKSLYNSCSSDDKKKIIGLLLIELLAGYTDKILKSNLDFKNKKKLLEKIRDYNLIKIARNNDGLTWKAQINYLLLQLNLDVYYICNKFKKNIINKL